MLRQVYAEAIPRLGRGEVANDIPALAQVPANRFGLGWISQHCRGSGGGLLAIVPRKPALVAWSPRLDTHGNSVAGLAGLRISAQGSGLTGFLSITRR